MYWRQLNRQELFLKQQALQSLLLMLLLLQLQLLQVQPGLQLILQQQPVALLEQLLDRFLPQLLERQLLQLQRRQVQLVQPGQQYSPRVQLLLELPHHLYP